jgi:DNA-binding CsgD family transcriptional regulator
VGGRPSTPHGYLTQRQTEVLDLVAAGLQRAAIARRLFISKATVDRHLAAIFASLDAHSSLDAVMKWQELKAARERLGETPVVAVVEVPVPSLLTITEILVSFPGCEPVRFIREPPEVTSG